MLFRSGTGWDIFLKLFGISNYEAKRLLLSFSLNSKYHFSETHDFYSKTPSRDEAKDAIYGIFQVDRYAPCRLERHPSDEKPTSTVLLVVDKPIEWLAVGRSAPHAVLYAPTGNDVAEFAEYSGLVARYDRSIYMMLKCAPPTNLSDMCQLILMTTDGAKSAKLKGTYSSANIEQSDGPSMRWLTVKRLSAQITDDLIEKYKKELVRIY